MLLLNLVGFFDLPEAATKPGNEVAVGRPTKHGRPQEFLQREGQSPTYSSLSSPSFSLIFGPIL